MISCFTLFSLFHVSQRNHNWVCGFKNRHFSHSRAGISCVGLSVCLCKKKEGGSHPVERRRGKEKEGPAEYKEKCRRSSQARRRRRRRSNPPLSISVHDPRKHVVGVSAGANEQQKNEKEGLKIEYCRLFDRATKEIILKSQLAIFAS